MLIDQALHILNMERPSRPKNKIDCPHHTDKTPSLHLYEDDWYCYSCGANGDGYGLIAAMTGREIGDVLKEYGDGDNRERTDFASRADQRRKLFNEFYEWQSSYTRRLNEALSDLGRKKRSDTIVAIHADPDKIKAELVSRDASPQEVESELRRLTSYLSYCLEVEQGLRLMRDSGASQVMSEQKLPRSGLQRPLRQAGRPGGGRIRGGSTARQLGSVRVGQAKGADDRDDRGHQAHPRLLRSERASS